MPQPYVDSIRLYYLSKKNSKRITFITVGLLAFATGWWIKDFTYPRRHKRPIYYDSTENKDNQIYDFKKSEIAENRSYFVNGKLIHQVNNQDCGSPFANDYLLKEQKRITIDFDNLKTLLK